MSINIIQLVFFIIGYNTPGGSKRDVGWLVVILIFLDCCWRPLPATPPPLGQQPAVQQVGVRHCEKPRAGPLPLAGQHREVEELLHGLPDGAAEAVRLLPPPAPGPPQSPHRQDKPPGEGGELRGQPSNLLNIKLGCANWKESSKRTSS